MSQDYMGQQTGQGRQDIKETITNVGLEFRLMTQYTSFVAVEEMVVTEGGKPRTVAIPVEMPEGVSYKGVFGDSGRATPMKVKASRGGGFLGQQLAPATAAPAAPAAQGAPMTTAKPQEAKDERAEKEAAGPPPAATEAEKRAWKLEQRLDEPLRGLAEKVAKEGRDGNLKLEKVEVKDGAVEVQVWLADSSDATIEKLKAAGLEIILQPRAGKLVIGRIKVDKLEALALMDEVKFIEPARIGG
jgi:hypothetical protein